MNIKMIKSPNFIEGPFDKVVIVNHIQMSDNELGTANWFANPLSKVSSNYGVGLKQIYQFVDDDDEAWANGYLRQPNLVIPYIANCYAKNINPNTHCISIEWVGKHIGGEWIYVNWLNPKTKKSESISTIKQGTISQLWSPGDVQYWLGIDLIKMIAAKHNIPIDRNHILFHSDFDKIEKWFCPGQSLIDKLTYDLKLK